MESDAELVAAVLAGRREPFATLVRRHERAVQAVAFAVSGDHHAARDTAQEAFLQAFQKLPELRDPASFGGWVRAIARHKALSDARRLPRTAPLDVAAGVPGPSPEHNGEMPARLVEAVTRLPEHEQSVVMLRYFDGHAVKDIAAMIGRPVGTVTMQLSRARERLRGWLMEDQT